MKKGKPEQHLFDSWDGKRKIDVSKTPRWWMSGCEDGEAFLRSLPSVKVTQIGHSAGSRPIIAASWGRRENLANRTSVSLGSAIAGGATSAYYGEGERKRQSLVFLGNAHGIEFEGTVAALNLLQVAVTGRDLRGRVWPRLHEFCQKLRIVVIPHLNVDGRTRYHWYRHSLGMNPEDWRRCMQGDLCDGTKLKWPTSKLLCPIPRDSSVPLGAYFNDNGVNLPFDLGLGQEPQPETTAFFALLREEMPDCVILSHTDHGSLVQPPDSFIPERYRIRQLQVGALVGSRCKAEGVSKYDLPTQPQCHAGEILYQSDLVYHVSGALPLTVEFPSGWQDTPSRFTDILDIGMYVLEEIVAFGVNFRFRPPEPC